MPTQAAGAKAMTAIIHESGFGVMISITMMLTSQSMETQTEKS